MCPHESHWIRWIANELPADVAREMSRHLLACPQCVVRERQLRKVWNALGAWEVQVPTDDLSGRVLAAASAARVGSGMWWRVAAILLLAAGAGVTAAIAVPRTENAGADTGAMIEQLVMEDLGEGQGLFGELLEEGSNDNQEARPL
jgi:hypothetical protein